MSSSCLIPRPNYSSVILDEFESVVGHLPVDFREFLLSYRVGHPCFDRENEDSEIIFQGNLSNEQYILESFLTLPQIMETLFRYDRVFGLSAVHRKFKLTPICTSGSSHRLYFIDNKAMIYAMDPNEFEENFDISRLKDNLICKDFNQFKNSIKELSYLT